MIEGKGLQMENEDVLFAPGLFGKEDGKLRVGIAHPTNTRG